VSLCPSRMGMFSIGRWYQRWEGGSPGEICSRIAEEILAAFDEFAHRVGVGWRLGRIVGGLAEGESATHKPMETGIEDFGFGEVPSVPGDDLSVPRKVHIFREEESFRDIKISIVCPRSGEVGVAPSEHLFRRRE
jgi:hypothetical protein